MARSLPHPISVPGMPGADRLFDVVELRRLLRLDPDAACRLRYVEIEPAAWAVAMVAADDALAAVSLGRLAPWEAGPQVAWFPDDPALPGAGERWSACCHAAGVDTSGAELLAWVPHRRLVLGLTDAVVKLHDTAIETELAVSGAHRAGEVVRVPEVIAVDADAAVHVQRRVPGRPLRRADAEPAAEAAGELLARLRQLDPTPLREHRPVDLLRHAGRVGELVGAVLPELAPRVTALLADLEHRQPQIATKVASHGDFNIGQLLADHSGVVVVDVDTLCAASPAYDPASYAANLFSGRPGDADIAAPVVAAMRHLAGDGAEFDWYLAAMVARRLDRGLRRYKRDWAERTHELLVFGERLASR